MASSADIQQLFDSHHNTDQVYQELCTLQSRLAAQQSSAEDDLSKHSRNNRQNCGFVESIIGACDTSSPVSADICLAKLLAVVHQDPSVDSRQPFNLLSTEQRVPLNTVLSLLKAIKHQQSHQWPQVVSCLLKEKLPLEVLWRLHDDDVLSLTTFLDSTLRDADRCVWLTEQIIHLCSNQTGDENTCQPILSEFCSHLVMTGFPEKKAEDGALKKRAVGVLDGVMKGLLDGHMTKDRLRLPTGILHCETDIPPISFKKFCTHTVSLVMSYNPNMKVSEALKRQGEWKSGKISQHLKILFKQLLLPFESGEVLEMLRRILDKQEVNWQMLLSCLATFLVCFPHAASSIQEHVRRLLAESLENNDMENTIVALLMVRQSCTEGPHVFPTYLQWFQDTFSDGSRSPAANKKSFTFLMNFLTQLVPFEPAHVLKVHILKPPFVPAKCRDLLADYIVLAKTRLADLKVPLEEPNAAIYSDPNRPLAESDAAMQDVEKALAGFESTGKLPTTVMEASIFRKPYFVGKFLPALLQPRHLPDVPDCCMKFIDLLKRAGKIPSSLYTKYQEACQRETRQLLEGVFEVGEEDVMHDMLLKPMEQLTHRLQQLTEAVLAKSTLTKVCEVISIVSEKLENLVTPPSMTDPSVQNTCPLDLCQPSLNADHVQVVDEILNCVCRTLYATHDSSCQAWLQQLVRMLGQHTRLHATLVSRTLDLITNKDSDLCDHHIEGLAAFVLYVSLDQGQRLFPPLFVKGHNDSAGSVSDCTLLTVSLQLLQHRTAQEMELSLRFLTAVLKFAFFLPSEFDQDTMHKSLPRPLFTTFSLLVWRLYCELRPDVTNKVVNTWSVESISVTDASQMEHDGVSDSWDTAAKVLYTSEKFQDVVKPHEPSLEEWLDFELRVDPAQDCLAGLERWSFHMMLMSHYCSQRSDSEDSCQAEHFKCSCSVLLEKTVLALSRVRRGSKHCLKCGRSVEYKTGSADCNPHSADCLLAVLAKILQNLPVDDAASHSAPWLLQQVFELTRPDGRVAPQALIRAVLSVPAYLLLTDRPTHTPGPVQADALLRFMDQVLMPAAPECYLSFDVISHILQGFFTAADHCSDWSGLTHLTDHPVLLLSSLAHWPQLCALLPSYQTARSPWSSFGPLLTAVDSLLAEGILFSPQDFDVSSFTVAAAVFCRLEQRSWLVDSALIEKLVQHMSSAHQQALIYLSEILLASLSVPDLCHQHLAAKLYTQVRLLSALWREEPDMLKPCVQQTDYSSSWLAPQQMGDRVCMLRKLLCAGRETFRDLACLRCLSALPADVLAAEREVVAASVSMFARLCNHFEDSATSEQVSHVGVMLDLSQWLHHLISVTPLSVLHTLDQDLATQCGLEIHRLIQQRLRN